MLGTPLESHNSEGATNSELGNIATTSRSYTADADNLGTRANNIAQITPKVNLRSVFTPVDLHLVRS